MLDLTLNDIDISNDATGGSIILYSNFGVGDDDDSDELEVDAYNISIEINASLLAYWTPSSAVMLLNGTNSIVIGSGASLEAYGEIDIVSEDPFFRSNADSTLTRPSLVPPANIHPAAPNSNLYWGNTSGFVIDTGSTIANFTANGTNLVFDMIGNSLVIVMGQLLTPHSNQFGASIVAA